jgi:hypothetical protein
MGSYAIKIPRLRRFREGVACNRREWARSSTCPKYCPVLWSLLGGAVIVMRRAAPITDEEFDLLIADLDADVEAHFFDCYGSYHTIQGEMKQTSWGIIDGRIVVVDYGDQN